MMISPIQWSWMRNTKASIFFQASHISGLLLIGRHTPEVLAALKSLGRPIASVDADCSAQGLDSFCNDDYSAGLLLARRLNMLGHRRIAAIFESPDKPLERQDESWRLRRTGFAEGWSKTRNPPPRWIDVQSRGDRSEVLPALNELLRLPEGERPSAVVTAWSSLLEDLRAIAAQAHLAIPRQLTVMGFGGEDDTPGLTAVRFNGYGLGRRSAEHLIHTICNRRPPAKKAEVTRINGRYSAGETHCHHLA
jgi:DNA-binding LacI/PurR family transcriptional regulator